MGDREQERGRVGEDQIKAELVVKKVKRPIEGMATEQGAGGGSQDSGHAGGNEGGRGSGGGWGGAAAEQISELSSGEFGITGRGVGINGVAASGHANSSKLLDSHGVYFGNGDDSRRRGLRTVGGVELGE